MADRVRRADHPARGRGAVPEAHRAAPARDLQGGVLGASGEGELRSAARARATGSATRSCGARRREIRRLAQRRRADGHRARRAASVSASFDECASEPEDLELWKYANRRREAPRRRRVPLLPDVARSASQALVRRESRRSSSTRRQPAADCSSSRCSSDHEPRPKPTRRGLFRWPNHECICRLFAFFQQANARPEHRQRSDGSGRVLAPDKVSTEDLSELAGRFPGVATSGAKPLTVARPLCHSAGGSRQRAVEEGTHRGAPEDERKWLTEFVAPIIQPEEEALFLKLTEPHQRESFKEAFWARREKSKPPIPAGSGLPAALRRAAASSPTRNTTAGGTTREGWCCVGESRRRSSLPRTVSRQSFRDLEIWTYANRGARTSDGESISSTDR